MNKGYIVTVYENINDDEALKNYAEKAREAVKKYGSTDSGGVLGDILGKALNLKSKKKQKK